MPADLHSRDLLRWRTRHGLTQAQAASLIGSGRKMWSRWETGAKEPHRHTLALISRLTEADVARVKGEG
jgi:transcriptional regulator with XRE-family HTH domain